MEIQKKKFDLSYKIKFDSDNQIKLWVAKPVNDKYQKIIIFQTNFKPIKKYDDKQDNQVLYFDIKDEKLFQADLSIEFSKDKGLVDKNWQLANDLKYKNNLKSELFLEQTQAIKKLTKEITKDKEKLYDKVKAIFDFVVDNFQYQYPVKARGVKNLNLKKLRGDCGEYSALLVTMFRILGIPAKNQTGFVLYPRQKKALEHAWVSAYLGKIGWLDFDPQYAAIEKNKAKYFGKRSDYRIVFTQGYSIPIKPFIPHNYKIDFWQKLGLPMTNKSAQVLQPAVFVSDGQFKFKSSFGM